MAKKRKTLPKDFRELLDAGDIEALKAVYAKCEIGAYDSGYSLRTALHNYEVPDEFVRWLVEQGLDINTKDYYDRTPLFYQMQRGNLALFLELGADVNAKARYGDTPLHFAADYGTADSVRLLLERGADLEAEDDTGQTPLAYCLARCSNSAIAKIAETAEALLSAGAKVTPGMTESVLRVGKNFEFHRENFNKDYLAATEAGLAKLYALLSMEPVARRRSHDGVSPITASAQGWREQHQELWEFLVPSRGAAKTVQGEVVRITGRVADELYRNGGANWNADYRKMLNALIRHFASGAPLPAEELAEAKEWASGIKAKGDDEDAAIDRLSELAVKWVLQNPGPMPLEKPDYNR
ncbi:MAG: ankyrin repeat domain-containing protein [Gracilibacteraceae bacterium]|nr:ankyrin repeat domain-containing protein [Gracilibacteraceae bacterium]